MPITKSAKKQVKSSFKKHVRNVQVHSKVYTTTKQLRTLIGQNKKEEAEKYLPRVYREIDMAAKKHVISKNTASRKKSRLASRIAVLTK